MIAIRGQMGQVFLVGGFGLPIVAAEQLDGDADAEWGVTLGISSCGSVDLQLLATTDSRSEAVRIVNRILNAVRRGDRAIDLSRPEEQPSG